MKTHLTFYCSKSLRWCVMFKDAYFNYFLAVYVVFNYTDMRYGTSSLAAIIERKYNVNLLVPNILLFFAANNQPKSKSSLGKMAVSYSCISELTVLTSPGLAQVMSYGNFSLNSSNY